ncbi:MAG: hypothetical protein EBW68_00390 [Actinobacteria bacterium]|nr:hypothetical protein [Actinomycetota bacterium]
MKSPKIIYMIGFGAVAYGLCEIFIKEKLYKTSKFIIIEPKDKGKELSETLGKGGYKHFFLNIALTKENCDDLLTICDKDTLIINVSVDVDSVMILKKAKECGSLYIDTSLEQYDDHTAIPVNKITNYKQFEKNNLFHQNELAINLLKDDKTTRVISCGMNPFLVNQFVKKALRIVAKEKGIDIDKIKGDYAKVGNLLGLNKILITEYDTQQFKVKSTPTKFVNDWSSRGLMEESLDNVMMSLSNEDKEKLIKQGHNLIAPTEKPSHIRFLNKRGMDMKHESTCLDFDGNPFQYEGYLIPHAETITLSDFFTYDNDAPTIFYVYRMSEEAIKGLDFIRKNDYEMLDDEHVVMGNEIEPKGWDSVGILLHFKNGERFWAGTVLSIEQTREMGFKSGPTVIQVAASLNACIKWELLNPKSGVNNAETIHHKFIFKHADKYLGNIFFKKL